MRFFRSRVNLPARAALLAGMVSASCLPAQAAPPSSAAPGLPPGLASASGQAPLGVAPVVPAGAPRVLFVGRPLPVPSPSLAPYRDPIDNILCVSLESLEAVGLGYRVDRRAQAVTLSGPDGRTVTVKTRRSNGGQLFVPLMEAMEALGGKCEWQQATNTVHVRALLTGLEPFGGQLRLRATLPVTAKVTNDRARRLILIEVACAERGALPKTLPFTVPGVSVIRAGQWDDNTARIVLEMTRPGAVAYANPLETNPSTTLTLNPLTGGQAVAAGVTPDGASNAQVTPPAPETTPSQPSIVIQIPPRPAPAAPSRVKPAPKPTPPAVIRGVSLRAVDDKRAQIVIAANRLPGYGSPAVGSGRFTLDLRNVTLAADVAAALQNAQHPLLSAVRMVPQNGLAARLIVDLTRAVAYTVSPLAGGSGLVIELALPRGAGGNMAGKLVVVDPGHGAHDSGAKGVNGQYEKNVNLAIGLKLRDELQAMGANVLLTRANDTFIPLGSRPGSRTYIANQSGADFYVSVHADSVRNRSVRGSTVYYHMQIPSCRALAQTIAERLGAMGGIPTGGPRSDSVLYNSGLDVLRNSRMVSVLVECGYMTNLNDVTFLTQTAMQQKVARSIAEGLRNYVEGYPGQDTRNVNPRPDDSIEDPNASSDPGEAAASLETAPPSPRGRQR